MPGIDFALSFYPVSRPTTRPRQTTAVPSIKKPLLTCIPFLLESERDNARSAPSPISVFVFVWPISVCVSGFGFRVLSRRTVRISSNRALKSSNVSLAQQVEHADLAREVAGSNPSGYTPKFFLKKLYLFVSRPHGGRKALKAGCFALF